MGELRRQVTPGRRRRQVSRLESLGPSVEHGGVKTLLKFAAGSVREGGIG